MEKMRILLVEDDQNQVDWAKKNLEKDFDITVVMSAIKASNELEENNFDFVITDLEIPQERKSEPEAKWGKYVFNKALDRYFAGELKGLALVSNYEHHVANGMEIDIEAFKLLSKTGLTVADDFGPIEFKERGKRHNLVVFLDSTYWWNYHLLVEGKVVVTPLEINRNQEYRVMAVEGRAKMLKPYKEIIEALVKNN